MIQVKANSYQSPLTFSWYSVPVSLVANSNRFRPGILPVNIVMLLAFPDPPAISLRLRKRGQKRKLTDSWTRFSGVTICTGTPYSGEATSQLNLLRRGVHCRHHPAHSGQRVSNGPLLRVVSQPLIVPLM